MVVRGLLEVAIWSGLTMTRTASRVAGAVLEGLFVLATWVALLIVGVVLAFQRGGLPWTDPTDARATSRSADSTARRAPRR
jgi:hypothetical protein